MTLLLVIAVVLGCDTSSDIPEYQLSGSWESTDEHNRFTEAESGTSRTEIEFAVFEGSPLSSASVSDLPRAVIVRYDEGIAKTRKTASEIGIYGKETLRSERSGFHFSRIVIDTKSRDSLETIIKHYNSLPGVIYAEEDHRVSSQATMIVNDTYYPFQWNFLQLDMGSVWSITEGRSSVTVAVIDTGIAEGISDFAGTHFTGGWNYISDNDETDDDNGHGTHVAGTVAQTTHNAHGTAGMAYGVTLMPIKVLDASGLGYSSDVAAGIIWASDQGADIINLSLGGEEKNETMSDAIEYAKQKGVTIFAASGNEDAISVNYPAAFEYVIAVGATTHENVRAYYSNYGPKLDIVAPGGDMRISDVNGILQQIVIDGKEEFKYLAGTSMASPHAAALGALLLSANPQLSPAEIKTAMFETADDLGEEGKDEYYGYGLINPGAALKSISDIRVYPVTDSVHALYGDAQELDDLWHLQAYEGNISLSLSDSTNDLSITLYDYTGSVLESTSGRAEHVIDYHIGTNGGTFFVGVYWDDS